MRRGKVRVDTLRNTGADTPVLCPGRPRAELKRSIMAKSEKPTPWYLRLWFIIPLGVLIFGGWLVIDLARGSDRGCRDDDRHVTDKQAGVCYEIPTGWEVD